MLAFLFLLPFPLSAQTAAPNSAPAAAPAFPQPAHGEKIHITGVHNAGKISETLYRGAQPREVGFSELKILGITTIVDLRGEDREKISWERQRAESLGMRFVNIPVSGWSPPTDKQVVQFLSFSPPSIAWPLKSGPLNKRSKKCISSVSTASGTPL